MMTLKVSWWSDQTELLNQSNLLGGTRIEVKQFSLTRRGKTHNVRPIYRGLTWASAPKEGRAKLLPVTHYNTLLNKIILLFTISQQSNNVFFILNFSLSSIIATSVSVINIILLVWRVSGLVSGQIGILQGVGLLEVYAKSFNVLNSLFERNITEFQELRITPLKHFVLLTFTYPSHLSTLESIVRHHDIISILTKFTN